MCINTDGCVWLGACVCVLYVDSVDTRSVLDAMRDLISLCNIYIDSRRKAGSRANGLLLKNIATYITRILRVNFCQYLFSVIGGRFLSKEECPALEHRPCSVWHFPVLHLNCPKTKICWRHHLKSVKVKGKGSALK